MTYLDLFGSLLQSALIAGMHLYTWCVQFWGGTQGSTHGRKVFTNQAAFPALYLALKEALMPLSKVFEPLCICNCNILKSELTQNTTGLGCKPFHLNASLRVV